LRIFIMTKPVIDAKYGHESVEKILDGILKKLIDQITDRIYIIEHKISSRFSVYKGSFPIQNSFKTLILDANRTLTSTTDYAKAIKFLTAKVKKNESTEIVSITSEAALCVLDKRLLKILILAKHDEIISPAWADGVTYRYFSKFRPESGISNISDALVYLEAKLTELGDPFRPQFSQIKADYRFSKTENTATASGDILGKEITEVGALIKANPANIEMVNVGVFYHRGSWVCANNRSLAAASISGIEPRLELIFPIPAFIKFYENKLYEIRRSTPEHLPVDPESLYAITFEDKLKPTRRFPVTRVPHSWKMSFEHIAEVDVTSAGKASGERTAKSTAVACGGAGIDFDLRPVSRFDADRPTLLEGSVSDSVEYDGTSSASRPTASSLSAELIPPSRGGAITTDVYSPSGLASARERFFSGSASALSLSEALAASAVAPIASSHAKHFLGLKGGGLALPEDDDPLEESSPSLPSAP
jgi:hypothetical protein